MSWYCQQLVQAGLHGARLARAKVLQVSWNAGAWQTWFSFRMRMAFILECLEPLRT